jgi:hypothetical protein
MHRENIVGDMLPDGFDVHTEDCGQLPDWHCRLAGESFNDFGWNAFFTHGVLPTPIRPDEGL